MSGALRLLGAKRPVASVAKTLTVLSGQVPSTQTNFPVRVNLVDMPSTWWDAVASDGRNIRVKAAGVDVPVDVVRVDKAAKHGEVFFKAPSVATGSAFTVEALAGASAISATDPIGRNAVWSGFDEVYIAGATSRTGSTHDLATAGSPIWSNLVTSGTRSPNVTSHQGLGVDTATNFYVVGTDEFTKYDSSWNQVASSDTPIADAGVAGANHLGDACVVGSELFVSLGKYPLTGGLVETVSVWDTTTLAFKRSHNVAADVSALASICYRASNGHFYGIEYRSPGTIAVIHEWDASFVHVGTIALSTPITKAQGITYAMGSFWVANSDGLLFSVDDAGTVTLAWQGKLESIQEGLATAPNGNDIYGLWDRGDGLTSYVYKLTRSSSLWFCGNTTGQASARPVTRRTTFTVGASTIHGHSSGGFTIVGYGITSDASLENSARVMLAKHSTGPIALWNSTDSWLDSTGAAPVPGNRYRFHEVNTGTTERKIYQDGVLAGTDAGIVARPSSPGDTFYINSDHPPFGTGGTLGINPGETNYVYLYNGTLSADWIAAEVASWQSPSTFYAIS